MKRFNIYVAVFSLLIDAIALFGGLVLAYQIRAQGGELFAWPFITYLKLTAVMLPVWLILLASQGAYNLRNIPRGWNLLPKIIIGLMAGWALMIIVFYFWRSTAAENFPRLVIIYGITLTGLFILLGRLLSGAVIQLFYRWGVGLVKVAVIADSESSFVAAMQKHRRAGRELVATLEQPDYQRLDSIKKQGLDELIAARDLSEEQRLELLNWAESSGVNFIDVPSLMSVKATNVEAGTLAGTPVMFFRRSPLEGWGRVYKRLLDLIVVVPALIILSPLLLVIFIMAQLSTGSGIIRQARVGQDGRTFYIHKFRSMYVDGDERFPQFKGWSADESKDPRITPIGRFLRTTNLDELAQLWDILTGTMSLVGPRPEQPNYVEKFAKEIPNYLKRHHVKSGLTGWAQVNGLRGDTSVAERVKYDLYYVENWSIWFDIRIILATFIFVLRQALGAKS